jgi:hypothetical protein
MYIAGDEPSHHGIPTDRGHRAAGIGSPFRLRGGGEVVPALLAYHQNAIRGDEWQTVLKGGHCRGPAPSWPGAGGPSRESLDEVREGYPADEAL